MISIRSPELHSCKTPSTGLKLGELHYTAFTKPINVKSIPTLLHLRLALILACSPAISIACSDVAFNTVKTRLLFLSMSRGLLPMLNLLVLEVSYSNSMNLTSFPPTRFSMK